MAGSDVHPKHRFEAWQVWPGSYDNPPADGSFPRPENLGLRITRSTPITSMGSCFAREIKQVLVKEGFSYVAEEIDHPATKHAGAAWERLYNTFSMRQIFEYTFGKWSPDLRWWKAPVSGQVQDPYRRIILYEDLGSAEKDFENHRQCSRRVLERAEVLILTLGLTEIWEDRVDGAVICLPSGPYVNEGGDMSGYRVQSEQARGKSCQSGTHSCNHGSAQPGLPPHRNGISGSFVGHISKDADVISASCNSKSTLAFGRG